MKTTALSLLALAACGDDHAATPDAPTQMLDAPAVACAANELPWTFVAHDVNSFGPRVAGVHVCLIEPAGPCVDTGVDGTATFCVPKNSRFAFSTELAGYMPGIAGLTTGDTVPSQARAHEIWMSPLSQSCVLWQSAMVACPPVDQALLWVKTIANDPTVDFPALPPIIDSVSIAPADAQDVFYSKPSGKDPSLTATDISMGNAYAVFAQSFTAERVTVSKPGATCHAFSYDAWPGTDPQTIEVPLRTGFRSFAMVTCD